MKESIKSIALDHITRDRRLQMRVVCDSDYIEQLKDALIELQAVGDELDGQLPIVYQEGGNNWLADGYQRWQAHEKAGIKKMKCLVRAGTFRDAQRFALSANAKHGERRTNADKRRAVEAALLDEEWGKLSDRAIAQLCGLDSSLVMRMRKEIQPAESQPLVRIGIDGKPHDIKPKAKQSEKPQPASIPESDDPAKQVLGLQPDAKDAAIRDHLAKYPYDVESDVARTLETTAGRVEQVKEQMRREAIAAQWEWQKLADQQAPAELEPVNEEAEFVVVDPPKQLIFIQRSVWHESQRTATGGGDGLSVLAKPKDAAQHKALPELRLIISQDQITDAPFVLHLQVRGPIVNAVVAHRRIPLKRLAGIFFSGDPEAKVIAAAYTVSEVQFIWRPKVTAGRITALITSPCLQGALPPDQQVVIVLVCDSLEQRFVQG
jgi:ParB-like chromosome segregation protein Spo0J